MKKCFMLALAVCLILGTSACGKKELLDPDHPEVIRVWHYYNGAQQTAFDSLVEEFNNGVGKEKGIHVESSSQGTVNDLTNNILDSAAGKVGAEEIPNIFAAYADTAYKVDQMGYVVNLDEYFTEEELDRFVDGFVEEGRFSADGGLKILPVAKSVEVFMLNDTDWDAFARATGADKEELGTMEGICRVAEQYYEWTDSLTPEAGDGKAFFGRDAMANYMIIGYRQLAEELFAVEDGKVTLHFERDVVKKLWDNYYVPYIKGYFSSAGRFRSDDVKTGDIISCICASSGAAYFPDEVILNDDESYPIEYEIFTCPGFEGGQNYAVQQGAGMVVTQSTEEAQLASAEFLKWFTEDEQNIRFSVASGYLPVTKSANDLEKIESYTQVGEKMRDTLSCSLKTLENNEMYTTKAFAYGSECRDVLEASMQELAVQDRAVVQAALEQGESLKEAAAPFLEEEYFDAWYEEVKGQLEELVQK